MNVSALQHQDTDFQEFLERIKELGGQKLLTSLHTLPILRLIFDETILCFPYKKDNNHNPNNFENTPKALLFVR